MGALLQKMEPAPHVNLLRVLMHKVKLTAPLIGAIQFREAQGLPSITLEQALLELEYRVDTLLRHASIDPPGEEWQRSSVRNCIIDFAVSELQETGGITGQQWIEPVASLMSAMGKKPIGFSPAEPRVREAEQVKHTINECTSKILQSAQRFGFLQDINRLTETAINHIFQDCMSFVNEQTTPSTSKADKAALLQNQLRELTNLFINSYHIEAERVQAILPPNAVQQYPQGISVDGVYSMYSQAKDTLWSITQNQPTPSSDSFRPLP